MTPPYPHTASGQGKGRGSHELEDAHNTSVYVPLSEFSHIAVTRCEGEAGKGSLYSVWLSVQLKVRRFISVRERGNGCEGQPVVSAADENMCRHQWAPQCADATGKDSLSPTRLQVP